LILPPQGRVPHASGQQGGGDNKNNDAFHKECPFTRLYLY